MFHFYLALPMLLSRDPSRFATSIKCTLYGTSTNMVIFNLTLKVVTTATFLLPHTETKQLAD